MKKSFLWLSLCFLGACTSVPLGPQAREEASFWGDFLDASYQQRTGNKKAFEQLEALLCRQPDSAFLKQLLVSQAVADGELEKATAYLDFIQVENPDSEAYSVYAAYQAASKDYNGAIDTYEKALAQDPDNDMLFLPYINLLADVQPQRAVEKIEQLAAQSPHSSVDMYCEIARLYLYHNRPEQALFYLEKAQTQDATFPDIYLLRSRIYERRGQYFLMQHELETLEKLGFSSPDMYNKMASFYLLVGEKEKAETYFLKSYEQNPSLPETCYFLSALAEDRQDYQKAIDYIHSSADFETTPGQWLQKAFYQKKLNQPKAMLETLASAYERFPDDREVGYFYALALNDQEDYRQSAHVLKKMLDQAPDYQDARLQYAYALESLKKYEEMEKQIGLILEENPNLAAALNLLAYSLAQRNERLDLARQYIDRALEQEPEDAAFVDTLAWILMKQEKWNEAKEVICAIDPEILQREPEMAYHMAVLKEHEGQREEALQWLEKAKDAWPDAAHLYKQLR